MVGGITASLFLNLPKRPYAPPARAWGHHHGAVPGAAEPEDLAHIEGGHYPPAVALTRLATQ
jgi:hypothetical protein